MAYVRDKELGFLKFFVYFMVFILMLGLVFVTYIVYKKNYNVLKPFDSNYQVNNNSQTNCKEGNLELGLSDQIDNIYHENNKIYVLTRPRHNNQELLIIDHCNKKVLGRISFKISNTYDHLYNR